MREIKFRAIYKPNGKTKDGYLIFHQEIRADCLAVIFRHKDIEYPFELPFLDDDWELMQYTGLKDKNGKEIYEGDICQVIATKHIGLIKWDNAAYWMDEEIPMWELVLEEGFVKEIEIIGNIYENAELMK